MNAFRAAAHQGYDLNVCSMTSGRTTNKTEIVSAGKGNCLRGHRGLLCGLLLPCPATIIRSCTKPVSKRQKQGCPTSRLALHAFLSSILLTVAVNATPEYSCLWQEVFKYMFCPQVHSTEYKRELLLRNFIFSSLFHGYKKSTPK